MKKYIKPELNITSYEAQSNIMLSGTITQRDFDSKKYSELFDTNDIIF